MNTIAKTGKYEIVESQVLFLDSPESELWLHLVIDGEFFGDIQVRFDMLEDEPAGMKTQVENGILTLRCVNFDQALGTGTKEPMEIGASKGKKLMLHLWSYLMGHKTVRKVEYSIFREI